MEDIGVEIVVDLDLSTPILEVDDGLHRVVVDLDGIGRIVGLAGDSATTRATASPTCLTTPSASSGRSLPIGTCASRGPERADVVDRVDGDDPGHRLAIEVSIDLIRAWA